MQEFDSNWLGIPLQHVITTGRKLVHRLNMYLVRFKTDFSEIAKITADLPEEPEPTVEIEGVSATDNTESEIENEEIKRPESINLSDSKAAEKSEPLKIMDNLSKAGSPSG